MRERSLVTDIVKFHISVYGLLRQGFQNEAYFLYTVLHISVLSVFFLRLKERDLKYSALEERGIFQVIRA